MRWWRLGSNGQKLVEVRGSAKLERIDYKYAIRGYAEVLL
jgi:hypothetical protein